MSTELVVRAMEQVKLFFFFFIKLGIGSPLLSPVHAARSWTALADDVKQTISQASINTMKIVGGHVEHNTMIGRGKGELKGLLYGWSAAEQN